MALIFMLLFLFLSAYPSLALESTKFHRNTSKLVNRDFVGAIRFVIEEIFLAEFATVNVIDCVGDPKNPHFKDFKNAVSENTNVTGRQYVFRMENCSHVVEMSDRQRQKTLVLMDNLKSFKLFNLTSSRFNFRSQFLFVFVDGYLGLKNVQKLLQILWQKNIYNLNLLYEDEKVVKMTTIRPFRVGSCNDIEEILVDTFEDGRFRTGQAQRMYPKKKFRNLHRCQLNYVTFDRCPAVCFNKTRNNVRGYDIDLLAELDKQLNFTRKIVFVRGQQGWGTILNNGTATGGLQKLTSGHADMGIGNYVLQSRLLSIVDASVPYFAIPFVFVTPPASKLSPFEKLLRPFEQIIWILLLVTFAIGIVVIIVIDLGVKNVRNFVFGRRVNTPIMNMLVAIFGLQQTILPGRNFARFILMLFLIFCLVNRNAYQGALYIFLQSDGRHKPVQTVDEMVERDFRFYIYESYADLIPNTSAIFSRMIVMRDEAELPFRKAVNETLKASFITQVTDVVHRNQRNWGKFALQTSSEQMFTANIVMYFRKNFFLKTAIDEKIRQFDAAGLLKRWIDRYADSRFLNIPPSVTGPKKLNLEHLFGVFNVMLVGHAVAIVVFVLEIAVWKVKKLKERRRKAKIVIVAPKLPKPIEKNSKSSR